MVLCIYSIVCLLYIVVLCSYLILLCMHLYIILYFIILYEAMADYQDLIMNQSISGYSYIHGFVLLAKLAQAQVASYVS